MRGNINSTNADDNTVDVAETMDRSSTSRRLLLPFLHMYVL